MEAATSPARPLLQLGRWSLASAIVVLLMLSLLLAARRFADVQQPLGPAFTVVLAILVAGGAAMFRLAWRRLRPAASRSGPQFATALIPTVVVLFLSLALFTSGTSLAAMVVAWVVIAGEEAFMLWRAQALANGVGSLFRRQPQRTAAEGEGEKDSRPLQSLVRTVEDDGTHVVSGTLRAHFAGGERTAVVHVGFCPPLPTLPHLECEQTDGPEAEIKLGQILAHGARFDVRLRRRLDEAAVVEMEFHASANEPRSHGDTEEEGNSE